MATSAQPRRFYEFGPFRLDALNRVLLREAEVLPISPTIIETLLVLVENRGNIVTKEDLLKAVWPDTAVEETNLTHNVSVLRKTLGEGPGEQRYIQTIPKRGYRFVATVREVREGAATEAASRANLTMLPQFRNRPARRRWFAAGGLMALAIVIVATYLWLRPIGGKPLSLSFTQLTDQPGPELYPSLSPDGKSFVYQSRASGKWDIYLQRVGGRTAINLTKDSAGDNTQPAFSPDGERIAFRSERDGGGIFLMGATGESAKRVTDFGYHPAWSPDGKEIVCTTIGFAAPEYLNPGSRLVIVNVATGGRRVLANLIDVFQPQWSPHGHRIAYWGLRGEHPQRDIWTVASAGGEAVEATNDSATDWNPVWSPDGRYLYYSSDRGGSRNIWRVPIDEKSGQVRGSPEPVTTPSSFSWLISFSRDGRRMAYIQQNRTSNLYKVGFDPAIEKTIGQPIPVTKGSKEAWLADISPDGRWVAFSSGGMQDNIFVIRVDGSELHQLTDDMHKDRMPRWSPDGKQIAFFSDRSGKFEMWSIKPDGSGLRQITHDRSGVQAPVWSPDGTRLAFTRPALGEALIMDPSKPESRHALPTLSPLGQGRGNFTPPSGGSLGEPRFGISSWSPDGRQLAGFRVGADGSFLGIVTYSFQSRQFQQLTEFGHVPRYLPDSHRLLFNHQGKLYLVDSRTKRVHEVLSVTPNEINPWHFGLSRDGRLIVFSEAITEADIWLATFE